MVCGNWNQGYNEDEEDDLNEDRRSQSEVCSCENGPMTSEHLLQHSPVHNDHSTGDTRGKTTHPER